MSADDFWNDRERAQKFSEESARLRKQIETFQKTESQLTDLLGMVASSARRWWRCLDNSVLADTDSSPPHSRTRR